MAGAGTTENTLQRKESHLPHNGSAPWTSTVIRHAMQGPYKAWRPLEPEGDPAAAAAYATAEAAARHAKGGQVGEVRQTNLHFLICVCETLYAAQFLPASSLCTSQGRQLCLG